MSRHGKETQFDYLLNSLELAAKTSEPAKHGYPEARRALFAYVRFLEREVALLRGQQAKHFQTVELDCTSGETFLYQGSTAKATRAR